MHLPPVTTRKQAYLQLENFFGAYKLLTKQIRKEADEGRAERIPYLMELRAQTINKIDDYQDQFANLFQIPFEQETDEEILSIRKRLREILSHCTELEEGLSEIFDQLQKSQREQAGVLAKGQRGLRAYSNVQHRDRKARYVEEKK